MPTAGFRYRAAALSLLVMLPLAIGPRAGMSQDEPMVPADELARQLALELPGTWRMGDLTIEASANMGDAVEPLVRSRFNARVALANDSYVEDGRDGPFTFLREVAPAGTEKLLYGTSESRLHAGAWTSTFRLQNPEVLQGLGLPLAAYDGRTIVRGTDEEAEWFAQQEREREEKHRAELAERKRQAELQETERQRELAEQQHAAALAAAAQKQKEEEEAERIRQAARLQALEQEKRVETEKRAAELRLAAEATTVEEAEKTAALRAKAAEALRRADEEELKQKEEVEAERIRQEARLRALEAEKRIEEEKRAAEQRLAAEAEKAEQAEKEAELQKRAANARREAEEARIAEENAVREARARQLEQLRAALAGSDRTRQIAAVNEALASDVGAIRGLGYEAALSGKDPIIVGLALRRWFSEKENIPIALFQVQGSRQAPGSAHLKINDIDSVSGSFSGALRLSGSNWEGHGSIAQNSLTFASARCGIALQLTDQRTMDGVIECQAQSPALARIVVD